MASLQEILLVTEYAMLVIDPARAAEFESAVAAAKPLFQSAEGCRSMKLERVAEDASRYRLCVIWDSIDHHMVMFRNSDNFQSWRRLVGGFFAAPPSVDHGVLVAQYFG
jgi:heme-degrading monooxygenase HmoA